MNVRPAGRFSAPASLMGHLPEDITIEELKAVLGAEIKRPGDKATHEWRVVIEGTFVTIHDYRGDRWHVGGQSPVAFEKVARLLNLVVEIPSAGGAQPGRARRS